MPSLRLRLLDAFEVAIDDRPITKLYSDRTRALLAYLAVEADRPHRRGELALLLWPDVEPKKARQNLRQTLRQLQLAIGNKEAEPPYLLVTRQTVQFNLQCDHWIDVAAVRAGDVLAYRGGLLAQLYVAESDLFNDWATIQREALHQEVIAKLRELGRESAESQNYTQAITYAQKQVEIDAWREEAYQDWMRYLIADGQSAEAQRVYEKCKQVLWDELGVEPSAETTAILGRMKDEGGRMKAAALPSNLPRGKAPLIGRKQELREIGDLLANPDCRWLTLVGLGGTGKTRLALAAAHRAVEESADYPDGVWFVSLVGATDMLPIAAALNLTFQSDDSPHDQLRNYLRDKQLLLYLDNCEDLLNEGAWLTDLLTVAPNITLLTTSRQSFDQPDEWIFDVSGLQTTHHAPRTTLSHAAELFLQAARRAHARFNPTGDDLIAIESLCTVVQGHPLSIELAASWVRLLSVGEISAEIERNLTLFDTDLRHLPTRQRNLRHVLDYTWGTLTAHERDVMARLAVFRGAFERDAAQAVANARLLDLLQLINRSLVQRMGDRFGLHEAVRQYAAEQLTDAPAALLRHAEWYARQTAAWFPQLHGWNAATAREEMGAAGENIRRAWATAIEQRRGDLISDMLFGWAAFLQQQGRLQTLGDQLAAARLGNFSADLTPKLQAYHAFILFQLGETAQATALMDAVFAELLTLPDENERGILVGQAGQLYLRGGKRPDLAATLTDTLAQTTQPVGETHLLWALMKLAFKHDQHQKIEQYGVRCLAILRVTGDRLGEAETLMQLGRAAERRELRESAEKYLLEAIQIATQIGSQLIELDARNSLGDLYYHQGKFTKAEAEWLTALDLAKRLGVRRLIGRASNNLGALYSKTGRHTEARANAERYLTIASDLRDYVGQAVALINLAYMTRDALDFPRTHQLLERSLTAAKIAQDYFRQAVAYHCLALNYILLADFENADAAFDLATELDERHDNAMFGKYAAYIRLVMGFVGGHSAETLTKTAQPLLSPPDDDAHLNAHVLYRLATVWIAIRREQYAHALDQLTALDQHDPVPALLYNQVARTAIKAWLHLQLGNESEARGLSEGISLLIGRFNPIASEAYITLLYWLETLRDTNSDHLPAAVTHVRQMMATIAQNLTDDSTRTRWRSFWLHRRILDLVES